MKSAAAALFLLLSSAAGGISLPPTPVFGDRILSFRDGLPGDQVLGLGEDHLGYLWVGTTSGLARLSEPDIEVFGTSDGLPSRTVYRIAEDSERTLWVGTLRGLAFFDGRRFRSDPDLAGVRGRIRDLAPGPDGALWALATPGGLWRRRSGHWRRISMGSSSAAIHMTVDAAGAVWLAGGGSGAVRCELPAGGASVRCEQVLEGRVLGIAAWGAGVVAVLPDELRGLGAADGFRATFEFGTLSETSISCVCAPDGTIYLGTSHGVLRYNAKTRRFERLRSRSGAGDFSVVQLLLARDGNLWLGTVARGAALIFTGLPVAFMNADGGAPGTQFYSISFLSPSQALIIEERGLFELAFTADGTVTSFRELCSGLTQGCPGQPASLVRTGEQEWIVGGADGARIMRRGPDGEFRFERSRTLAPLDSLLVIDSSLSPDGTIWFATPRGPFRLRRGGIAELVPLEDRNPGVRSVSVSRGGRVWVFTQAGRLWTLSDAGTKFAEVKAHGRPATAENMFLPPDGRIWITRSDGSAESFDSETAGFVDQVPGESALPGLSPASFIDLGSGRYLAAHRGGVSVIRFQPLSVESRLFSPADLGDPDLELAGTIRDPSGAVWLESLGSLVRFEFAGFRPPASAPLSVERVIDLRSGGRALTQDGKGSFLVGPAPNATEVDLACPDHVGPHEVRLRTRLLGEDEAWGEWSPDRRVRLVNLAAGSYRLEAQALDRFGRINPIVARVALDVRAPFRETWPFRLAVVGALALIVAGVVRWRVSRLVARQAELESVVEDRTRELAQANALLAESSLTDPLTGLRNRRYLTEVFAREIANRSRETFRRTAAGGPAAPSFYFLMIDLDHFKEINDRFGHAAGDAVLAELASILREETRKGDILVRWGGEEFLVVSRPSSAEGERVLAERIRSGVAQRAFAYGPGPAETLRITCSAGFVAYPVEGIAEEVLRWTDAITLADHALYHAKQSGRDRWVELVVRGETVLKAGDPVDLFLDILLRDPAEAIRRGWIDMSSPKKT